MKLYTVQISDGASRQLAKLPQKDQQLINAKIVALALNPRPPGSVKLAHRSKVCRQLERLRR